MRKAYHSGLQIGLHPGQGNKQADRRWLIYGKWGGVRLNSQSSWGLGILNNSTTPREKGASLDVRYLGTSGSWVCVYLNSGMSDKGSSQ